MRGPGRFLLLAFGVSWLAWAPLVVAGEEGAIGWGFHTLGAFGPTIAALAVWVAEAGRRATVHHLRSLLRWRVPAHLWLAALAGPAAVVVAGIGIAVAGGAPTGEWQDPGSWYLTLPVFGYVVVFGGPLGEELGWRGFLLPRIEARHRPIVAALTVGIVWAAWHAPLFAVEGSVQQDVPPVVFGLQILVTSVFAAWLWNRSASLPLVIGFHAAFNTTVGLLPVLPDAAGSTAPLWASIAVGALLAAGLVVLTAGRLGRQWAAAPGWSPVSPLR